MMTHNATTHYKGGLAFESTLGNFTIQMNSSTKEGEEVVGASPKKMLLSAVAGCTGMDVVSMLEKMRAKFTDFKLDVTANLTEEHPKIYDKINIAYIFTDVAEKDKAKIEKAVKLSKEKYCGVSAMLGKAAKITYNIVYQ